MQNKKQGQASAGFMLMKPLVETATDRGGVRSLYDVRVHSLVVESDGRVVGITARQYGTDIAVRARRGVVLGTGSFAYNESMMARFTPRIAGRPISAVEQHDGQGIRMAQALGADLAHTDATEVAFVVDPQQLVRGILVNARGQRYVAEDTYPGRAGQLTLYHQNDTAYLILDEAAQEEALASQTPKLILRKPKWVCETVAELEAEMGLPPPGSLQDTVARYNEGAARGEDPLLHKKARWLRPIGSPVGAIDLRHATGGFPLGGVAHQPRCRGAARQWRVDPGPVCSRTLHGGSGGMGGYASGISLGDGSFYGRRAGGRAAARGG